MNNFQTKLKHNPRYFFILFYYKRVFMLTFLTFIHCSNFSIVTNHCINNDQHSNCASKGKARTWYLPSRLVEAKILVRGVNHVLKRKVIE